MSQARNTIRLNVRDLTEAQVFYRDVVGCRVESREEHGLHLIVNDDGITCVENQKLGKNGRVGASYQLQSNHFVPIPHRIDLKADQWQALANKLRRRSILREVNCLDAAGPLHRGVSSVSSLDPSGNPLEAYNPLDDIGGYRLRRLRLFLRHWIVSLGVVRVVVALIAALWSFADSEDVGPARIADVYHPWWR